MRNSLVAQLYHSGSKATSERMGNVLFSSCHEFLNAHVAHVTWGIRSTPLHRGGSRGSFPWLSLFYHKNNIISLFYTRLIASWVIVNLEENRPYCDWFSQQQLERWSRSSDHCKKTVGIPPLDSSIIQMQDRFSDEDRHARHVLCLVPPIIVTKALQLHDEQEDILYWKYKTFHFPNPLEMSCIDGKHSGSQQIGSFQTTFY